uniref:NADH-ubiquinone oxidoreductase chain 6 n=1 Tax=Olophrum piceum TaxID=347416 RepID=A0A0S2M7X4_9COLE|nr:NADH dehydrogenase subunit 6 [Olophrum piceum]ALO70799.1 NADH deshydrogenase subunit 6 [Olophrum piceum]
MILMMTSMMLSCIFLFLNHPLSMGMILLMQTVLISLITGFMSMNFWFSYILFLIMVGGMLVLFIYMTSIASNEKFEYSNKIFMVIFLLLSMMILMYLNMDLFFMNMNNFNMESIKIKSSLNLSLSKFLNFPSNMMLFLMIIYLFITLIAVVKITNINIGPLRQKF